MPTETNVKLVPAELTQIVVSVFETMMGLDVGEVGTLWFPGTGRLTAAVHLQGDWTGAVLFECTQAQACQFAGRFLSMDPPESVDDVVRDVLGELANMIGGNLKCVLSPKIRLSMPSVVDGSDYSLRICRVVEKTQIAFRSDQGPFWITILTARV